MFTHANPYEAGNISIDKRKIFRLLLFICTFLVAASIAGNFLQASYPENNIYVKRYVSFFDLNRERNLPTLYSTFLLLVASLLNFLIFAMSRKGEQIKRYKFYWLALAFIFIFLSVDESLEVHEKLNGLGLLHPFAEESSFFYYVWVVPYTAGVLITGLLFLRFLFGLPPTIRNRFFLAGFVYVSGALFLEFGESFIHVHLGRDSVWERVLWTAEEAMEMVGVIIFIYALMKYIALSKAKFEVLDSADATALKHYIKPAQLHKKTGSSHKKVAGNL